MIEIYINVDIELYTNSSRSPSTGIPTTHNTNATLALIFHFAVVIVAITAVIVTVVLLEI